MSLTSPRKIRARRNEYRRRFLQITGDLLENQLVLDLEGHRHHLKYTRLRHSLDVAYRSYLAAEVLGLDSESVARAGLLHDLFFHEDQESSFRLTFSHPVAAVENARKIATLNQLEENIILGHMWPFTRCAPKYRESFLVSMVDKYSAFREYTSSVFSRQRVIGTDMENQYPEVCHPAAPGLLAALISMVEHPDAN